MINESDIQSLNIRSVMGIDEVGRGSWAGPLIIGAVLLDEPLIGLSDSKKLSKPVRTAMAVEIKERALFCNTGWVWPDEIDTIGLTAATTLGIKRALEGSRNGDYRHLIIDGSINFMPDCPKACNLIKADGLVPAVSAASIFAKVTRDLYMSNQHLDFPDYGFQTNAGYGTKEHIEALETHGITPLHRQSYRPVRPYCLPSRL
jgi:ribonuclease HII